MVRSFGALASVSMFAAACLVTPVRAIAAPTQDACLAATAKAPAARTAGKFRRATAYLRTCAAPSCAPAVRAECRQRLDDISRAQPTIVFDVRDERGAPLRTVSALDDSTLALIGHFPGAAAPIDPGERVVKFVAPGFGDTTRTFVIAEGEKGRRETVTIPKSDDPINSAMLKVHEEDGDVDVTMLGTDETRLGTTMFGSIHESTLATAPFDIVAATAKLSLAAVDVQSCAEQKGPTGPSSVVVAFSPTGQVDSVVMEGAVSADTKTGRCVAGRFRALKVPAFSGVAVALPCSFVIPATARR